MALKYIFYPGCFIPAMLPHIEHSIRYVLSKLNVELQELPELSCCPPKITSVGDFKAWLTISARNLAIATKYGLDLLTPCNGCFESFFEAKHFIKHRPDLARDTLDILKKLGLPTKIESNVKHFVEVIHRDVGLNKVSENIVKSLSGLKVAVHYGCHLFVTKPGGDVWEKPRMMDEILRTLGVEIVRDGLERICCGFVLSTINDEKAILERSEVRLKSVKSLDVDCLVTPCPQCLIRFEYSQIKLRSMKKIRYDIPVLHLAELLAIAFGLDPLKMRFDRLHRSPVKPVFEKLVKGGS